MSARKYKFYFQVLVKNQKHRKEEEHSLGDYIDFNLIHFNNKKRERPS